MKKNGFTLIELLVVVAIIGILAAVGVVAYNGYTSSAKKSAAKSNHSAVCKWVSVEAQKISLGVDRFFMVSTRFSEFIISFLKLLTTLLCISFLKLVPQDLQ